VDDDPLLPVRYTSTAVAPDGTVAIAYTLASEFETGKFNYELRYAWSEDGGQTFDTETVCGGGPGNSRGKMPSLKFDGLSVPHIAFINSTHEYDAAPYTLVEYVSAPGGVWGPPGLVDGASNDTVYINPSLAFDSLGVPAISYCAWASTDSDIRNRLFYARNEGTWTVEQVNGVHAGAGPSQNGATTPLAFGVFSFGGDPMEVPTIAFSDPANEGHLYWTLRRGADDWFTLPSLDDGGMTTNVGLYMWKADIGGGNFIYLPRISYRFETGSALFVLKGYVQTGQLKWTRTQADFNNDPGTGFFSDPAVAFEAGYEMIFVTCWDMNAQTGHLCIENLISGEYTVYNVLPNAGLHAGEYISQDLLRVGSNDKAIIALVMDENLYVSVMK